MNIVFSSISQNFRLEYCFFLQKMKADKCLPSTNYLVIRYSHLLASADVFS